MTRKVGNILIIEDEDDQVCELCGGVAETRPYGPNNEQICWPCGQKDMETTNRKFMERLSSAEGNTIN